MPSGKTSARNLSEPPVAISSHFHSSEGEPNRRANCRTRKRQGQLALPLWRINQTRGSLPLDHQQTARARLAKGIGCNRYGALPSLSPSTAQSFYWRGRWSDLRGDDSSDTIINHLQGYKKPAPLTSPSTNNRLSYVRLERISMAVAIAPKAVMTPSMTKSSARP